VIEDLDSIPYTVITLSDSLLRFKATDTDPDSKFKNVENCYLITQNKIFNPLGKLPVLFLRWKK
jgi:hypothetical protein